MTNKRNGKTKPPNALVIGDANMITEYELIKLLDTFERLQAALRQFATLLDSESAELVTQCQVTVKTISDNVAHIIAFEQTYNGRHQHQLDNWENEGGQAEYGSE